MGWRIVGAVGRVLMTAGTLILLFVAYQLWGTGLQEARSQDSLRDEFAQLIADSEPETPPTTTTEAPDPNGRIDVVPAEVQPGLPVPSIGDPVAQIEIPRIGITRTVVSGVSLDQLERGPGHYPNSPLPGQRGNVAIAGHRTTFGQPFHNVDKLEPGDQILTQTVQGEFVYRVTETVIVKPDELWVLEDQYAPGDEPTAPGSDDDGSGSGSGSGDDGGGGGGTLAGGEDDEAVAEGASQSDSSDAGSDGTPKPIMTLIACHPKYSLAERIIVFAELEGVPAPEIEGQAEARAEAGHDVTSVDSIDAGLSGETSARTPAVLWGLLAAVIWLVTWLVQVFLRRRARSGDEAPTRQQRLLTWSPYLVGLPLFLIALYGFFYNFSRFLPGNY